MASPMLTRPIPSSGEALPVIGLGTWKAFDVRGDAAKLPLREVVHGLLAAGGRLIDSSPMYGAAEEVVGEVLRDEPRRERAFLASKVWTRGRAQGEAGMRTSMRLMGKDKGFDLMQVHNLLDADVHLPVMRAWKKAGTFRYIGVTHYSHGAFADLERHIKTSQLDFVQLPYSVADREAEKRLLPAARDAGVAVITMEPFATGDLFRKVAGKPLPAWAADCDARSWAALFLKWLLAETAVTCVIRATSKPSHLAENVAAGVGRLPDAALRKKIVEAVGA